MFRLMNSAMMPAPGIYHYSTLTAEEFGLMVRKAHEDGTLASYIGYQQTADVVASLSNVHIPVCRDQTVLKDGDKMLVIKLKYRVGDPKTKGDPVKEDFEYGYVEYQSA